MIDDASAPPAVTVLIPVHNAAAYLEDALASLIRQTFVDFEVLAIDDHSSDGSSEILRHFASKDSRIRVLARDQGTPSLASALNEGLDQARGEFIARLDADDVALPHRLARQVSWLASHPDLALVGSFIEMIDEQGDTTGIHREPLGAASVALHSMIGTPFAHPAVMLRLSFLNDNRLRYHEMPAQDYDLWARMISKGARGDNIPEALTRYRVHPTSDSNSRAAAHERAAHAIALRQIINFTGGERDLSQWTNLRFQQVAHAVVVGNTLAIQPSDLIHVEQTMTLLAASEPRLNMSATEVSAVRETILIRKDVFKTDDVHFKQNPDILTASTQGASGNAETQREFRASVLRSKVSYEDAAAFQKIVPVFINARDRVSCLEKLVSWLEKAGHENITIIDNASTYEPLLTYLEQSPHRVIKLNENIGHKSLWHIEDLHAQIMSDWFVYTDPDVVPCSDCPLDAVSQFRQLMNGYPSALKIGFGLRIDDLPDHYHLKQKVVDWESSLYGKELEPEVFAADIDTTFALYRPGVPYCYGPAIRTRGNLQAHHLPWYTNSSLIDDEEAYYRAHASASVTTWNVEGNVKNLGPEKSDFTAIQTQ